MTLPDPALPTDRRDAIRELAGLVLMLLGSVGVLYAAVKTDALLGLAVLSVLLLTAGWRLSMTTVPEE